MIDVLRFGFGKKELLKMTPEEREMLLTARAPLEPSERRGPQTWNRRSGRRC
jgi:hypothetical protein